MDAQFIKESLMFISDDSTRTVFCTGVALGVVTGFLIGVFCTKYLYFAVRFFYRYISAKRVERECKKRDQEKRAETERIRQAKKQMRIDKAERITRAMNGLHYNSQNLIMDDTGKIYCPSCMAKGIRSAASCNDIGDIYCPNCGWNCPIFFTLIH